MVAGRTFFLVFSVHRYALWERDGSYTDLTWTAGGTILRGRNQGAENVSFIARYVVGDVRGRSYCEQRAAAVCIC